MSEYRKTPTEISKLDVLSRLNESKNKLFCELEAIRTRHHVKTTNAKMISVLHECPCRLRCLHDITNPKYDDSKFDRLYTEKHNAVKNRLIDAIANRFPSKLISSEHKINTGHADIAIWSNPIIRLDNGKKVGIEVKTGKSIEYFQIERYLYDLDVLLVVRVITRDVVRISQKDIAEELNTNILSLIKKIQQINTGNLIKVEGDWCRGCTALCQNKKPEYSKNLPVPTLADYSEFYKNVNVVEEKVIHELELEFLPSQG